MKITREIKTAILVIASILLFIWGYSFLKGRDLLSDYQTFYVKYDNVEGLINSAPVTINGLVVGKVNSIKLNKDWTSLVELQIDGDYQITKNSVAELYSPGPIGGKQITIIPDLKSAEIAKSGDFLQSSSKLGLTDLVSNEIKPIKEKLDKVLENANTMLVNINQVLDDKTKQNLRSSLENLNATLAEFKEVSKSANEMLADNKGKISSTMSNVEKASANFSKISDSIAKANIGQTVKNLEKTLANVDKLMADIQSGKGTLGKLAKDETMYNNFAKTSKELELLLQDLRLNPTRYVNVSLFGKKNKPYKAPVADTIKK
ncbi:MlaD family protein [Flavobacterium dankookense]|uniref:Phospholipid/cholesterol/gamma-HCH transport system substrate-binding protein n=1 Tax=Flavobacterium dankookense TaxID=706186 RepID=A0A4R6QGZ8_9FLAO|nr:MlaD family protein [Flavobacterium dankookense]TDP60839.1 phospholipid/cholesterol/gamma-HCH transport system substrate-binding protein [Flavobacterium dankookense]